MGKRKRIACAACAVLLIYALPVPAKAESCVALSEEASDKTGVEEIKGSVETEDDFIKWVSFDPPYDALKRAMDADIESYGTDNRIDWIELLALLSARYWGRWENYSASDLNSLVYRLQNGESVERLAEGYSQYDYYYEAYGAVLSEFLGLYAVRREDGERGEKRYVVSYGLKAFCPIAEGFWYSHYDDYGASRSYGFSRVHLGNDLLGSVGTPVVAAESGIVEAAGWNQYGGWRIGIRSFDGKRYYYYAHLRKDWPYTPLIKEGRVVKAGEVIGYLGRTGYSLAENVNNIKTAHLHFGMQLIFDRSQEDGAGEIWIDVYNIVKLLAHNRSAAVKDELTREYERESEFYDLEYENIEGL